MKANNGCGSSAASSLSVSALTLAPGTISGAASVCKSQTSVNYSVAAVTGATSYTWTITGGATFVGSNTGASVNVKFTTATSTSATLTVKANNACGSSTTSTKTIAVTLNCKLDDDVDGISEINVYPNPTPGKVNVSFNSALPEKLTFKVVDVVGRILYLQTNSFNDGSNSKEIDLSEMASGIYFIVIEKAGEEIKTLRVAVQ